MIQMYVFYEYAIIATMTCMFEKLHPLLARISIIDFLVQQQYTSTISFLKQQQQPLPPRCCLIDQLTRVFYPFLLHLQWHAREKRAAKTAAAATSYAHALLLLSSVQQCSPGKEKFTTYIHIRLSQAFNMGVLGLQQQQRIRRFSKKTLPATTL